MKASKNTETITLVGAGLAGSLLAVFLARRGYAVEAYERLPDMRTTAISAGRSINLALSHRGIYALNRVGLDRRILSRSIAMRGRMIHAKNGEQHFIPYGKDESEVIYSVSRRDLNVELMNAAEETGSVKIHFERRCSNANFRERTLQFTDSGGNPLPAVAAQTVIATDGATSAVRMEMQKIERFDFSQSYLEHGYKELCIPPQTDGTHRMERNALHIWPRGHYMLIALPNLDGSFTCTLFLPYEGDPGFRELTSAAAIESFFETQFPDAKALMPTLTDDFLAHQTGSLITVKCFPWHVGDNALLLGDAAHAIVPFYGQGMNCAFEDCVVLDECLERGESWEAAFSAFENLRKENTDAIAELAVDNFIEMRDSTANPKFAIKREVEQLLEKRFPGQFVSKYGMVTFQRVPYAEALHKGRIQDRILNETVAEVKTAAEVNLETIYQNILRAYGASLT